MDNNSATHHPYFMDMADADRMIDALSAREASMVLVPLEDGASEELLSWIRDVYSNLRRKGGE